MIKIRVLEGALFQQDTHCCSLPSEPLQCKGPRNQTMHLFTVIIFTLYFGVNFGSHSVK